MGQWLAVGVGGFFGAIARHAISTLLQRFGGGFPLGTLVVNLLGCFLIGGLVGLLEDREFLSSHGRLLAIVGLLGSFTTFSTFGNETFDSLRDGHYGVALLSVVGNVGLGLLAVALGRMMFGSVAAAGD